MLRKFIFKNNTTGQEIVLPVTPESYTIDHGNHVETVNLHTVGDYNLPGGRTLFTCTLSGLLPRKRYPFVLPEASLDPFTYIDFFEFSSDRREVCRFVVSDTPTIADVLIENWQYGERDGTNDVYYTLTLRRFLAAQGVRTQSLDAARSAPAQTVTQQTYTFPYTTLFRSQRGYAQRHLPPVLRRCGAVSGAGQGQRHCKPRPYPSRPDRAPAGQGQLVERGKNAWRCGSIWASRT